MNLNSENRLKSVIPELAEKNRTISKQLSDRHHIEIEIVSAFRSFDEQNKLFAQGRTSAGQIVTKARGGQSWHNFGLAVDVCPFKNGVFLWNADNRTWLTIANCARLYELESGYFWKFQDKPHLQLTKGFSLDAAKAIFLSHGLPRLWKTISER